jgi:hypothetical protein
MIDPSREVPIDHRDKFIAAREYLEEDHAADRSVHVL